MVAFPRRYRVNVLVIHRRSAPIIVSDGNLDNNAILAFFYDRKKKINVNLEKN